MDQLMLLAQLCGEGKKTEAILRSHGFEDLESIVNIDSRELSETLGISDQLAIRMVRQAEDLLESSREKQKHLRTKQAPPRRPPERPQSVSPPNAANVKEIKAPAREGEKQPGVTPAELEALRPPEPEAVPDKRSATGVQEAPDGTDEGKPKERQRRGSFWYFG